MAIDLDVHGNTKPLEAAVQAAVNRIRRQPIKITIDDKGATQPLGNMKRGADEFTKSMEAANARILAFGASMAIINGVGNAFKGMVKNLVEVEKSLADINVVMGLSAQNLEKFGDGLFKVAKETGAAFRVAADAATEYARQGLSVEESLKRTRDALVLTRLTGMDSAEAVKSLTAAMNTYGNQIKDTTQLVSKFAAVDVKFAVSAQDFADAISRTGQSAKSAGVSIDELVGIVTAAQQKTARGGAVIGNALKTIFTKTGRTDTLNQLENLGIAVRDLEGNTVGAKRILTDLANTFDKLSEAQKAQITQTMGGLFHINILKAVLSDAAKQNGIMAEATRISAGATDEAIQKNEELRKTLSAVATETGLAIKQVSAQIGEIALAPGMEKILNTVKSLAEGLSGVLGDGEGMGNKFATGLLKGIGNVITGPGLVVLASVFFKLFGQALKFTKESLTSLVGVTTEKQKQKAIQTSLVALFGQNAALNKEMLRTDIGRTEKEKIILGLLKAQVVEANALNKLTAGMAGTLYRKGYGANLTPIGKKASGHIPNFANPERAQAARGGYAAGSIRTMNMPGEGPVIYNSAETVKNFAGFKQPAIMPPQSSKAGKNYQQAFGDIHGFDPYAAGGYIPNFSKTELPDVPNAFMEVGKFRTFAGIKADADPGNTKAREAYDALRKYAEKSNVNLSPGKLVSSYLSAEVERNPKKSLAAMLVPSSAYTSASATKADLSWPVYGLFPDKKTAANPEAKLSDLSAEVRSSFKNIGSKYGSEVASIFNGKPVSGENFWNQIESDRAGGAKGAWKSAVGAIFEAAINAAIGYKAGARKPEEVRGGKKYAEADFDVRGNDLTLMRLLFDGFPESMTLADYKSDSVSKSNVDSFYDKVIKQKKYQEIKDKNDRDQKKVKKRAYGHIPNFAANSWESEPKWKWSMNPDYQEFQKKKNLEELNKRLNKFGNSNITTTGRYSGYLPIARITDPQTGTYTDFTYGRGSGEAGNSTSIIYSSRGKQDQKGGAFRNFGILGDFTSKQGGKDRSIYSDFDQINVAAGKSPWAMVLRAFPQLKQRIKPGMVTSGEMNIGHDTLPFNSLRSLKMQVSKWVNRNGLQAFLNFSKANLGFNEKNAILSGTSSGELFSIGGLRTRMLTRRDKNYLNDSKVGFAAGGYIPNFADPLSDAIGREKAAGVPVSQIRVGSHGALMNKNNPLGLGVTNTHDEPNGLRDVFGANGFVPNYAEGFAAGDISKDAGNNDARKALARKINEQIQSIDASIYSEEEYRKEIDKIIKKQKKNGKSIELSKSGLDKASQISKRNTAEIQKNTVSQQANTIASQSNTTQVAANTAKRKTLGAKLVGGIKNMNQGMGGMGLMMGLPMLAGFIPGADKPGSAGGIASGMMSGAATGAAVGMMFPGWGTAIGAAVGALGGFVTSLDSAKDAIKEEASARGQFLSTSFGGAAQKIFSEGTYEEINKKKNIFATFGNVPQEIDFDFWDILMEGLSVDGTSKFKSKRQISELREDMMQRMGPMVREEFLQSIESFGDEQMNLPKIIFDQEKGKKTISKTETEVQKASEFKKFLESSGDLKDIDTLSTLARSLLQQYKVEEINTKKTNEAIILRLNKEKTLLSAQDKFNKHMNQSAELQAQLNNEYNFNMRTRGHLMTESEKAEETYNQAVINAAAKYRDSVLKSESDAGQDIIKTLQSKDYEGKFKDYLAKEGIDSGQFAKKSLEEQREILKLVGEESNKKKETVDFLENQKQEMAGIEEKAKSVLNIEEQRARTEKQITDELMRQKTGPGAMGRGMDVAFHNMREQVKTMDYELGQKIPFAFADGLANAMTEALNGTKSIKEALSDAALSFLQMIQQAMMQKAAYSIVGAMGFSRGGNVRNYSRGGGVPARVSNGEYVMGKDAVRKYGGSFMHSLNAGGQIPGFSDGGSVERDLIAKGTIRRESDYSGPGAAGSALAANFGGGRGFKSGRAYQRKAMSGFFYSQSGNVGLGEDTAAVGSILQEEERRRQEAEAKRQAKKAKRRQLIGSLVGIAAGAMISKGASFLSEKGFFGQAAQSNALLAKAGVPSSSASWLTKNGGLGGQDASQLLINAKKGMPSAVNRLNSITGSQAASLNLIGMPDKIVPGGWMGELKNGVASFGPLEYAGDGRYYGGSIRKYASGGHIAGKSGIDQIPAMLSEGEYVIRASSARQIGRPMLDRINAGKFYDGGAVSEIAGSSETGSTGGNTNNINISINMERGSSNQKQQKENESSGVNPADASSDEKNNSELAERIKQQVVSVIMEEQRPGGLLSD